VFCFEDNPQET